MLLDTCRDKGNLAKTRLILKIRQLSHRDLASLVFSSLLWREAEAREGAGCWLSVTNIHTLPSCRAHPSSLPITEVISKGTRHRSTFLGHGGTVRMLWGDAQGIDLSNFPQGLLRMILG